VNFLKGYTKTHCKACGCPSAQCAHVYEPCRHCGGMILVETCEVVLSDSGDRDKQDFVPEYL